MKRISWCKKQINGIQFIEPNLNLSNEYYKSAEESLRVLKVIKETNSNILIATMKYYTEYFAVYSILMKLGIKSEIHDCTIAAINFLEEENIVKRGLSNLLDKDKGLRIDNQYYLKNKQINLNFDRMSEFLVFVKEGLSRINANNVKSIREKLRII